MNLSFGNPFFEELVQYPLRFATPILVGDSPGSVDPPTLNNGTATLLKLGNKFCAVTCQHVLEAYRDRNAGWRTMLQVGPVRLDPITDLISESRDFDLAIFDMTRFIGYVHELTEDKFAVPVSWPPGPISLNDVLCLAGFPGVWREQEGRGRLCFYSFSSGTAEVSSIGENHLVTRIQLEDCIANTREGKVIGDLGGLSGGPVFVWRKGAVLHAELVGFMYEYQKNLDLMLVRLARVIRDDASFI